EPRLLQGLAQSALAMVIHFAPGRTAQTGGHRIDHDPVDVPFQPDGVVVVHLPRDHLAQTGRQIVLRAEGPVCVGRVRRAPPPGADSTTAGILPPGTDSPLPACARRATGGRSQPYR